MSHVDHLKIPHELDQFQLQILSIGAELNAAIFRLAVVARNVDQSNHSVLVLLRYLHSTVFKRVGLVHGNPIAGVSLP